MENKNIFKIKKKDGSFVCGHAYPSLLKMLSIDCRSDVKKNFHGVNITYDHLYNLATSHETPFKLNFGYPVHYLLEMMHPSNAKIRKILETDSEVMSIILIKCRPLLYNLNWSADMIEDMCLRNGLIKEGDSVLAFKATDSHDRSQFLENEKMTLESLDIDYRHLLPYKTKLAQFYEENGKYNDSFLFWSDYPNYGPQGYVELLEHFYKKSEFIWIQLNFEFSKTEKHANQLILEMPKDSNAIILTIYEPWLYSEKKFNENSKINFHKKLRDTLMRFVLMMTDRTDITIKRKHIPEFGCLYNKGLQPVADLGPGLCLPYSQFMTIFYLVNKNNTTLRNEEEISCILTALQGNVLRMVLYFVYYLIFFSNSKHFKIKMKQQLEIESVTLPNLKILLENPPNDIYLNLQKKQQP
jgi:hypothetical protein